MIGTAVFDEFLQRNRLRPEALAARDDREIAHAFQQGALPPAILGDLLALVREVRTPLAVRSSSRLEDALRRTSLPARPDHAAIDRFLVDAYRRAWGW